jgi:hypothetical protein
MNVFSNIGTNLIPQPLHEKQVIRIVCAAEFDETGVSFFQLEFSGVRVRPRTKG